MVYNFLFPKKTCLTKKPTWEYVKNILCSHQPIEPSQKIDNSRATLATARERSAAVRHDGKGAFADVGGSAGAGSGGGGGGEGLTSHESHRGRAADMSACAAY